MVLLLTLPLICAGLFYAFDGHTIVAKAVTTRYRKFRSLNNLVETQYKSGFMIFYVSVCMIAKMYWTNFLQWSNRTVKRIDKNTVTISYVLRGKLYTFVVKEKRGPRNIISVSDENDEDVSDEVLPFLGPGEDVHQIKLTPSFFGKKSLTLITVGGDELTYSDDQYIETERTDRYDEIMLTSILNSFDTQNTIVVPTRNI